MTTPQSHRADKQSRLFATFQWAMAREPMATTLGAVGGAAVGLLLVGAQQQLFEDSFVPQHDRSESVYDAFRLRRQPMRGV